MNYLQLEGVGKPISQVMMGTGWFAPQYEADIFPLLDYYLKCGGTVLDTGRFYSGGASETVVRKWLDQNRDKRDSLVITSKACHHYVDENNRHHLDQSRVSPAHITEDLTYSLSNLGLDYFDVFLMHRDDCSVPVDGLMDRLELHYREHRVHAYGVSNWTQPRIEEAIAYCAKKGYRGLQVNSPSFSLAKVTVPRFAGAVYADRDDLRWNEERALTVFAWGAQGAGFFSESFPKDDSAPEDIRRAYFTQENFARFSRAKELAEQKGCAVINIALAYVLRQNIPMASVIAPHNIDELRSSLLALDITLSETELDYLEKGKA